MRILNEKKGMYEFILTKSVMLIFILGLVGIFYGLYTNLDLESADDIAESEAERLAKIIDNVIGFQGVSTSVTIYLKDDLKVGNKIVAYDLKVTGNGIVVVELINYPYIGKSGAHRFGLNLTRLSTGTSEIKCEWPEIQNIAKLIVTKTSEYKYDTAKNKAYNDVSVTIDASEDCYDKMDFQQKFYDE